MYGDTKTRANKEKKKMTIIIITYKKGICRTATNHVAQ